MDLFHHLQRRVSSAISPVRAVSCKRARRIKPCLNNHRDTIHVQGVAEWWGNNLADTCALVYRRMDPAPYSEVTGSNCIPKKGIFPTTLVREVLSIR